MDAFRAQPEPWEYFGASTWPQKWPSKKIELLCLIGLDAKLTTNRKKKYSVLQKLKSCHICLGSTLVAERHGFLPWKIESDRPVVTSSLSIIHRSVDKDRAQVHASWVLPDVELAPEMRAWIWLKRMLYLLKSKRLECVQPDWWHYNRSTRSSRRPNVAVAITEPPVAPSRSFAHGAKWSRPV